MSLTLTPDELADLTDCKRTAEQIDWLRARKWRFEIGRTGKPKVSRVYAEMKLGVKLPADEGEEPDFSVFHVQA